MRFIPIVVLICFGALSACSSRKVVNPEPALVTFHSNDLKNFWLAFDQVAGLGVKECAKVYDEIYLKNGSQGLHDFYKIRLESSEELCEAIIARRAYYEKTREILPSVDKYSESILKSFNTFKKLYTGVSPVEVYYLIGWTGTVGTVDGNKLLIGLETFPSGEKEIDKKIVPKHLLAYNLRLDLIPAVAIHELVHTQQKFSKMETLLENAVMEGVADFLTKKIHGSIMNDHLFEYGQKNEKSLKKLFAKKMNGKNLSDFLYNSTSSQHPDMGYYIGYRIAESYYKKHSGKQDAIERMLHIYDFEFFLKESGYFL
jgi:hypothetical protein